MYTKHAEIRAQQRGIPPLISLWLDQYGHEEYGSYGCISKYFTKASIRAMERDFGRKPIRQMQQYFDCYKVVSSRDGTTVTIGHRTKHLWRK